MQSLSRQMQQFPKVRRGWGDTTGKNDGNNFGGGRCSFRHYHLLPKSMVEGRKKFRPSRSMRRQQGWQGITVNVLQCSGWEKWWLFQTWEGVKLLTLSPTLSRNAILTRLNLCTGSLVKYGDIAPILKDAVANKNGQGNGSTVPGFRFFPWHYVPAVPMPGHHHVSLFPLPRPLAISNPWLRFLDIPDSEDMSLCAAALALNRPENKDKSNVCTVYKDCPSTA